MELDELVLHIHKLGDASDDKVNRELNNRFLERTEIRPNRIVFHDMEEMRHLLGVGVQLKEQKVIDHRPGKPAHANAAPTGPAPMAGAGVPVSNQVEVKS
jgi:hypothetical protein